MTRVFALAAVVFFAAPVSADDKNLWAVGTKVLPKKSTDKIAFTDRDPDGRQVYFTMSGHMPMTVRKDSGDGSVRIHDGHREGWVSKGDLVQKKDALMFFDQAVKANPTDTWVLYMRAVGQSEIGEFDNAIKDFTEYIRLQPTSPDAYNGRGIVWNIKQEYDKAIADSTEAIRLNPKFAPAYSNRGNAWHSKGEYGKAIGDFTEAIRLDPKSAHAYSSRGIAWLDKKEFDKALADFDRALKLDPKDTYAIGNKGRALTKLKKYDEATKAFEAAIKLDPMGWLKEYALFLATCPDEKHRDGKMAVEHAKKAIEKAGKDADWGYFATLAAAYAEVGDFDLAVTGQKKALEDKLLDAVDRKKMEARLELYKAKKPYRDDE